MRRYARATVGRKVHPAGARGTWRVSLRLTFEDDVAIDGVSGAPIFLDSGGKCGFWQRWASWRVSLRLTPVDAIAIDGVSGDGGLLEGQPPADPCRRHRGRWGQRGRWPPGGSASGWPLWTPSR